MFASLAITAVVAVGSGQVGDGLKEAPTAGAGDFLQSDPAPPQLSGNPEQLKETPETLSRAETLKVSFHDAVAFDPMWAAILDPGWTLPRPAPAPQAQVTAAGVLTSEQLDHYAALAGWPADWWPSMKLIIGCESGGNPNAHNGSDPNGGSSGLTQLNGRSHFDKAGEDFEQRYDPVVNLRTALWLRTVRGHFGGAGGWKNCAAKFGIY